MTKTKRRNEPSPTGWYVGSYLIRFTELNTEGSEDPDERCLAWENTVLVMADSLDDAYDKVVEVALATTQPYQGGPHGIPVQWVFEGLTELLPVYEELEHGAEIMYREYRSKKLKNLRKLIHTKDQF